MKKILLFPILGIILIGCAKKVNTSIENHHEDHFVVTENFEAGTKKSYLVDTSLLSTGKWIFNNALLGNLAADSKNGQYAARLKKGFLETYFEVSNVDTLIFSYAKYLNVKDVDPLLTVSYSIDGGKTYDKLLSNKVVSSSKLIQDTIVLKNHQATRFRFENANEGRLNIDDITFRGKGISGVVFTDIKENPTDTTVSGNQSAGLARLVTAGADAQAVSGDNSNLLLGNPSKAQSTSVNKNNYLIDQKYYTESYDADRGTPNWVSWHLQAADASGTVKRQDDFAPWAGLQTGWYQVTQFSYSGSGYDRGHNCPSADRTSSLNANSATFLMTNMIPQASQNNQKTWGNLEMYIRDRVRANSGNDLEAYIIMGSYGKLKTIDNGKIAVPTNVWKIVVFLPKGDGDLSRINAQTEILAVNTPNDNSVNEDWKKYIVSISTLETATGYQFLSAVPAATKAVLKDKQFSSSK